MSLDTELISQFAKIAKYDDNVKKEVTVYGTVVDYNGKMFVRLDGSDRLTPVETTSVLKVGQRVTVLIKNHSATVTGNISSPSVGKVELDDTNNKVDSIGNKISEFEIVIADKVSTKEFDAQVGRIDELVSDNVVIKSSLTATEADIKNLKADNVVVNGKITTTEADIKNLKATKLDADIADIKFAKIENLNTTNANIHNLQSDYGSFKDLTTNKLTATEAQINKLDTEKLSATDADIKYANIDFANIGEAAIKKLFTDSGIIKDLIVNNGHITGELVGVTIKGDLIQAGTLVADKLVVKGSDGLYYKLNTDGATIESEQTDYNSLNGSVITAKSITASKISVDDLVAFGATIGGFKLNSHAIYSGVKETINNSTTGIYLDDSGQIAFGDSKNFVKFFKDKNQEWKLHIKADELLLGSSGTNIEEVINGTEIGGTNMALDTNKGITGWKWSTGSPGGKAEISEVVENNIRCCKMVRDNNPYNGWSFIYYATDKISVDKYLPNKKYTVSFDVKPSIKTTFNMSLIAVNGKNRITDVVATNPVESDTWTKVSVTLTTISQFTPTNDQVLYLSGMDSSENISYVFRNLKIEEGTVSTAWTPAPEDMATSEELKTTQSTADNANSKAESNSSRIQASESSIKILSDSISSLVTDSNGKSMMTQTANGWTFNISNIEKNINDATSELDKLSGNIDGIDKTIKNLNDLTNSLNEKTAYIVMTTDDTGNPCLELGKEGNEFKVRITNTSVDFMEGSLRIAYVNNKSLYIERAIIKDELQIGEESGFIWKRRSNGNMGLRWVGGKA